MGPPSLTTSDGLRCNPLWKAWTATRERKIDMSLRHSNGRMRILLASAATVLILAPGIALAGGGTGGSTDDDAQMIADAKRTENAIVVAWNEKKWDELGPLYAEDAVVLPPNHDPVKGRAAIVEYYRGLRDALGELGGLEPVRDRANGRLADLVTRFTAESGHVRMIYQGLYERQPDGSVLLGVDQPALIDAVG